MSHRVVAVTGANRGLGLALVKRLATSNNFYSKVILCSRDAAKGKEALDALHKEGKPRANIEVAALDMDSDKSIDQFCTHVKKQYGQIHALVNNAGILVKDATIKPEVLEKTASTNLFGMVNLTERFLRDDMLEKNGKLIGVSTKLATSSFIKDEELKKLLSNIKSQDEFRAIYEYMLNGIKAGNISSMFVPRFPFAEYSVMKRMMSIYHRLLTERKEVIEKDLFVATLCPGWCKTDLGGAMATNSVESGTDVSYELLTQETTADHPLQGKLIYKSNTGIKI